MARSLRAWATWAISFLCACSAAVPVLPVQQPETPGARPTGLVIHSGGYQPVDLSREEFQQGMRMLHANGPLPGLPKGGKPRLIFASADPIQMARAAGYLDHCQRITGKRFDCWDELNVSGGLDDEGAAFVALHFALGEALEEAASAVGSMTPTQVRAMMSLMFLGMIVQLLSSEPVTKLIFMVSMTNLIAFVGVDLFNHVVKGFTAMLNELKGARDFEGVRAAGVRYGQRIGPTVGRIVVMVATYGIAKSAGLFKGNALDLPGGARAGALAEEQGFRLSRVEGARSITLTANGSVVIDLGTTAAMTGSAGGGGPAVPAPAATQPAAGGATPPEKTVDSRNDAYEKARAGGPHAGTLRNYAGRSTAEIRKAIQSHERQVALHKQKLANPAQYAEDWSRMTPEGRAGLLRHWQEDIQALADVLRGLLQ